MWFIYFFNYLKPVTEILFEANCIFSLKLHYLHYKYFDKIVSCTIVVECRVILPLANVSKN